MSRTILLLDMNAYFASIEQVSNPALRGRPIAVCGKGRTIVVTCSYEARKFGVKTAMSLPEAKKLCPQIIPVYADHNKYIDTSIRIHNILLEFTDQVEVFSIDECFMDITCLCARGKDPSGENAKDVAMRIKQRLKEETGLTCSIGIGPNKVVAKVGAKLKKPDGLVEIKEEDIPAVFSKFSLSELQGVGVGDRTAQALRSIGINSARELGEAPVDLLVSRFGVNGRILKNIGLGRDESEVKRYVDNEQEKSFGHSHTLARDTYDLNVIHAYLRLLSEKVGARLREAIKTGRTVCLFIRYGDFDGTSRRHSLKNYIRTGREIYQTACRILETMLPLKKAVRLVGVGISNLMPDAKEGFLFPELEKERRLTDAVDSINKKFGEFTVKPSSNIIAENHGAAARRILPKHILESGGILGRYHWRKRSP